MITWVILATSSCLCTAAKSIKRPRRVMKLFGRFSPQIGKFRTRLNFFHEGVSSSMKDLRGGGRGERQGHAGKFPQLSSWLNLAKSPLTKTCLGGFETRFFMAQSWLTVFLSTKTHRIDNFKVFLWSKTLFFCFKNSFLSFWYLFCYLHPWKHVFMIYGLQQNFNKRLNWSSKTCLLVYTLAVVKIYLLSPIACQI